MIIIVDYGTGNLLSVKNMLNKIGCKSTITSDKKLIESASKLILPGVGAFDGAIKKLRKLDLIDLIKAKAVMSETPILGICLGMQLLTNSSQEGKEKGLGLIDAQVEKFHFKNNPKKLSVPHMGWNQVQIKKENKLLESSENQRFYFVHSYAVYCNDQKDILSETYYGNHFVSCFAKKNILGAQFHPEKSHKFGMAFLKNFVENY